MNDYDKPPDLYDGLRLHQNEHTWGCSPRVLEPGCSDCIRMTTGIVEHTRRGITVLEGLLCAAR